MAMKPTYWRPPSMTLAAKGRDGLYDKTRAHATAWRRQKRWRVLRRMILNNYPFCVECLERNIHHESREVDHIRAVSDGGGKYDPENLQALCKSCHSRKTQREIAARRPERRQSSHR